MPIVTNLNNSGTGSLRAAVAAGGTITFSVGGDIVLKTPLTIDSSGITIDASSAPSPGIGIWGHQINVISGGDNFTIRHVRLLPGDFNATAGNGKPARGLANATPSEVNGIQFSNVTGGLVENCSIYWCMDEALDVLNSDVTFRQNIIAMPLHDSNHPSGNHSMACLIEQLTTARTIRLYNNLFLHSLARNPGISVGGTGKLTLALVGNIFYNTSTHALHTISGNTNAEIDAISNAWIYGADTNWGIFAWAGIKNIPVYKTGNIIEYRDGSTIDPWLETSGSWVASADLANQTTVGTPHVGDNDSPLSRNDLFAVVGASNNRWQLDTDMISDVQNKTGYLQNSTDEFSEYFPPGLVRRYDVVSDMSSHYKFNSNLISSVNGDSLSGTATYTSSGQVNTAVIIPSGGILSAASNSIANVTTGNFSITGWVRWPSYPGATTYIAYKKADTGSTTPGYILYTNPNGSLGGIITDTSNSRAILVGAGSQLTSNTWYHVAMVLDREANIFRIFINGVNQDTSISFDGSGGATSLSAMGSLTNTNVLSFGRASAATIQWHDDWRFYDRAILQKDIDALIAKSYIPKNASLENTFKESITKSIA